MKAFYASMAAMNVVTSVVLLMNGDVYGFVLLALVFITTYAAVAS